MSNEDGADRTPRRPGLAAIEVHQVSKRFGEVRAVRGVSFTIERGCICALLGANGAGKTTTVAIAELANPPDRAATDPRGLRQRVGLQPPCRGVLRRP